MKKLFTFETNQKILKTAGSINLFVGFVITFIPKIILNFFGVEPTFAIEFWQFFGVIVGVTGIAYFVASSDSEKYWPIVFIGFLGSLLSGFIFIKALVTGSLPLNFALFLSVGSLIWTIPFYYILQVTYDAHTSEESPPKRFHDLIGMVRTSRNATLRELSQSKNVLLVFVRQFGCTFCRETVYEMAKIDKAIAGKNLTLVFVHMSDPSYGDEFFSKYYDQPVHHISDPGRNLYKCLNLKRGRLMQVAGPKVWLRGIYAGIFKGHGLGEIEGDILQLGGAFILSKGEIIFEQKANCASDRFQLNSLPEF